MESPWKSGKQSDSCQVKKKRVPTIDTFHNLPKQVEHVEQVRSAVFDFSGGVDATLDEMDSHHHACDVSGVSWAILLTYSTSHVATGAQEATASFSNLSQSQKHSQLHFLRNGKPNVI